MVTVVRWFIRITLLLIFIDWFKLRTTEEKLLSPAGMIMIDIESQSVAQCAFGCSANDLKDGDIVPMEIRLTKFE